MFKKRLLVGVLGLLMSLGTMMGLSSCDVFCREHQWGDWTILTEGTCTELGTRERTCGKCKEIETGTFESSIHTGVEVWESVDGKHQKVYDCCGEVTFEGEHEWADWSVIESATCSNTGVQERFCSVCEDREEETIEKLPHAGEEVFTCTEEGHVKAFTCCGEVTLEGEHEWNDWVVTDEGTCNKDGSKERDCSVCEYVETEAIEGTKHEMPWVWETDENVHKKVYNCCNTVESEGEHDWSDWVVTDEGTCQADGSKERKCLVCEYVETEAIEGTKHTMQWVWVTGKETHKKVYNCCNAVEGEEAHDWSDWREYKAATCTKSGTDLRDCSICSLQDSRKVDALDHDFGEYVYNNDATCTEDGTKTAVCQRGDCKEEDTVVAEGTKGEGNHVYVKNETEEYIYTNATCTSAAVYYESCEICGAKGANTFTGSVKAGHVYEWAVETEASCDTEGLKYYQCKECKLVQDSQTIPANGHNYQNGVCSACGGFETQIILTTNKNDILVEGTSQKMYFYAQVLNGEGVINRVYLYNENGAQIAEMKDDGVYASSGDEFSNDGIYTCVCTVATNQAKEFNYYVKGVGNSVSYESPIHIVKIVANMTDNQIQKMEQVDQSLGKVFADESYQNMTTAQREQKVSEHLDTLVQGNYIASGTIVYNTESYVYTFEYESGAIGAIDLKEYQSNDDIQFPETNDTVKQPESNVNAIILWSFNQVWDNANYRTTFYQDLKNAWSSKGIATTITWDTTIASYKNLSAYDIIVFSTHGSYYEYRVGHSVTETIPTIVLSEKVTRQKDAAYAKDLKMQRIGKMNIMGGTVYTILPSFWDYYYAGGKLDGSFVFSESADFMGSNNAINRKMSDAIIGAKAESVIGFHNAVMADYSRNFMQAYVESLVSMNNTKDAFNRAKEICGNNDYFVGREAYGPSAYPMFNGDEEAVLINNNLKNGSFEEHNSSVLGWTKQGDIRILNKLGELVPQHGSNMAILTTGVGSGTSDYTGSQDGSVLQQSFNVGSATTISFMYDTLSEEPMEYVGRGYNDRFEAYIILPNGQSKLLAKETVDGSKWIKISNINFEGGDNTCYHTGWKTVSYDLSAYQNQTVTIRFIVADVGDSAYDTAALIDKVELK